MIVDHREPGGPPHPLIERLRQAGSDILDAAAGAADGMVVVLADRLVYRLPFREGRARREARADERVEDTVRGRRIEGSVTLRDEILDRNRALGSAQEREQRRALRGRAQACAPEVFLD